MVEPASRGSSQLLSKIRDELLKGEGLDKNPSALWGPCLHSFDCPLAQGRNYCHMSIPTEIPGKWFRYFSKALGSERLWLKFSFVWFSSPTLRPQPAPAQVRRVISDPIPDARSAGLHVLLCEPALPNTLQVRATHKVFRGDLVDFTESKSIVRNEAKGRNESQGRNDFQIRNESRVQAGPKILIRPKIKTRDRF